MKIVPVILCGGSGSRLWPMSRSMYPKQLLAVSGGASLLQDTIGRLAATKSGQKRPVVVCNEAHRFLVSGQLGAIDCEADYLLEPEGRNTAPAVAVAAAFIEAEHGADALMLVLAADHVIRDARAFAASVARAVPAAADGKLVTFGIVPTAPETGYGYIRTDLGTSSGDAQPVREFVEKPDFETARRYVQSGCYLWNSGMFLFEAGSIRAEMTHYAADIADAADAAMRGATRSQRFVTLEPAAFRAARKESIDYAVMERTEQAVVVPLDAGWSDVGSWASWREIAPRDVAGNAVSGDVVALDCRDSLIRAEHRLVGVVGLNGCIVVETKDSVLVVPAERAQDVKRLVEELERKGRPEVRVGREVFRPWGSYDSVDSGPGFQVKRLTVLPGASMSLQLHRQRAEHWVVVSGVARITRDDEVLDLTRGQHTFIPLGARHRIENPGPGMLEIIEVQIGDYLGEDDIVRFDDRYGRQGRTD